MPHPHTAAAVDITHTAASHVQYTHVTRGSRHILSGTPIRTGTCHTKHTMTAEAGKREGAQARRRRPLTDTTNSLLAGRLQVVLEHTANIWTSTLASSVAAHRHGATDKVAPPSHQPAHARQGTVRVLTAGAQARDRCGRVETCRGSDGGERGLVGLSVGEAAVGRGDWVRRVQLKGLR